MDIHVLYINECYLLLLLRSIIVVDNISLRHIYSFNEHTKIYYILYNKNTNIKLYIVGFIIIIGREQPTNLSLNCMFVISVQLQNVGVCTVRVYKEVDRWIWYCICIAYCFHYFDAIYNKYIIHHTIVNSIIHHTIVNSITSVIYYSI